jgi:hypothetical protein
MEHFACKKDFDKHKQKCIFLKKRDFYEQEMRLAVIDRNHQQSQKTDSHKINRHSIEKPNTTAGLFKNMKNKEIFDDDFDNDSDNSRNSDSESEINDFSEILKDSAEKKSISKKEMSRIMKSNNSSRNNSLESDSEKLSRNKSDPRKKKY